MFSWAAARGLVPESHNPAKGIERYREEAKERFLTEDELSRLGAALVEAETIGLPWDIDPTKPRSKHLAKDANQRTVLEPFVVASIRLLILTGARLREILDAQWTQVDFDRGIIFVPDSKNGRKFRKTLTNCFVESIPQKGNSPLSLYASASRLRPIIEIDITGRGRRTTSTLQPVGGCAAVVCSRRCGDIC